MRSQWVGGRPTEFIRICWIVASLGVPTIFMICTSWSALSRPRKSGYPVIISAKLVNPCISDCSIFWVPVHSHTADTPDIDARAICPRAEQDIRSTIPQCHHLRPFGQRLPQIIGCQGSICTYLIAERVHRNAKRPRQPEIANLELPSPVDQQILRFEISVQHPIVMAESDSLGALISKNAVQSENRSQSRADV